MPDEMGYSSKWVLIIGVYFVLCNILLNYDNGALPACLTEIMVELEYSKVTMGSLGSYVYLGFVIGSVVNGAVFVRYLSYK